MATTTIDRNSMARARLLAALERRFSVSLPKGWELAAPRNARDGAAVLRNVAALANRQQMQARLEQIADALTASRQRKGDGGDANWSGPRCTELATAIGNLGASGANWLTVPVYKLLSDEAGDIVSRVERKTFTITEDELATVARKLLGALADRWSRHAEQAERQRKAQRQSQRQSKGGAA